MFNHRLLSLLLGCLMALSAGVAAQPIKVLATVKPLALIARAALPNDPGTEVDYLFPPSQPAHELALKASHLRHLAAADVVIWVGPGLEGSLQKVIGKLPADKVIRVDDLPLQWPSDAPQEHVHGDHHHRRDPHVWLNPHNANQLAQRLQQHLGREQRPLVDSGQLARYAAALSAYKTESYIFQHDGYSHFTDYFGLDGGKSLRSAAGIERGVKNRLLLSRNGGHFSCLFYEPQYGQRQLLTLAAQLQLPLIALDPQGSDVALDDTGYQRFLHTFIEQFTRCFQ